MRSLPTRELGGHLHWALDRNRQTTPRNCSRSRSPYGPYRPIGPHGQTGDPGPRGKSGRHGHASPQLREPRHTGGPIIVL
jgi:hypothetical protein